MLGSGINEARIVDRKTGAQLALGNVSRVQWGREIDSWSQAQITISKAGGLDCCGDTGKIRVGRHNLSIYRDGIRVWGPGPIVKYQEFRTYVQVTAYDALAWLNMRMLRGVKSYVDVEPTRLLGAVLGEAFGRYDKIAIRTAFTQTANVASLEWDFEERPMAWTKLRDLLADYLDITMVGDILYAGSTTVPAGAICKLTEDHIAGDIAVVEDGSQLATIVHATGQNGVAGTWPPEPETAPTGDDYWGVVDGLVDRNQAATTAEATTAARSAWVGRRRPPLFIDMPTGARLKPTAPVSIDQLIPGAEVRLAFTERCRPVNGRYAIAKVDVSQGGGSGGTARSSGGQFMSASDAAQETVQLGLIPYGS